MHLDRLKNLKNRRAKILVMSAISLPVVVSGMALSLDLRVLTLVRGKLQVAADAAALAGAKQLADDYRVQGTSNLANEMAAARAKAIAIGQSTGNGVLGSSLVIHDNPSNDTSGDVVCGYLNTTSFASALDTSAASTSKFNSTTVNVSRSADRGGVVPSFFGAALGYSGWKVTASSTATAQPYKISGFKQAGSQSSTLIPLALDQTTYNQMITGVPSVTTDEFSYDPSTKTITSKADGVRESKLFPVSNGSPGNWGSVKIGVSNNSTATLGAQIQSGVTAAQLATFPNGVISLSSTTNPPSIIFGGNPGISAGIKADLVAIMGKAMTIPIYSGVTGNGNNAEYTVVGFAGVRIVDVNFQGNPKYVIVQPALVNDSTATIGSPTSWTSGGVVRLSLTR